MIINVHAGHTKQGGKSPGAGSSVTKIYESVEDRKIVKELIKILKEKGHTVYNCTAEGNSMLDNLKRIVSKCNAHEADLDISIHLNCYNGNAYGTEAYIYASTSKAKGFAQRAVKNLHALGFEYHSGDRKAGGAVKTASYLYVLRHTNAPACLIECFFCDSMKDAKVYKDVGYKKIAAAIAKAVK